ncbi:NAD(P)-dependent alcohol dehydrogenase [Bremerella sp. JC817]|uniref:NADPH-dependent aldehyde reductase Ahr n=1 Tax=Bremerella sp. JC817 TaxID=3231756 RepID=UPI003457411B
MSFRGFAATAPGKPLESFEYDPGDLLPDEVEIDVDYCGLCHSDLSMADNEWGISSYPFVPGHEVVGRVAACGDQVKHLKVGQKVGLGWKARSCMVCPQCMTGNHHRCPNSTDTIVGRNGGFANKVRCQGAWAIPIPETLDAAKVGPMFCGGVTVFNPLIVSNTSPMDHVAVVGIGGLGHMALQFAKAWGCEVTAFSTSPDKEAEAKEMGAHHFLNSKDDDALSAAAGKFDMVLVTVNVMLDWDAYVNLLKPGGRLHIVGAIPKIEATWFPVIAGERTIGGSPIGSPALAGQMLDFSGRHAIAPIIEEMPMSKVNDALEHLKSGKARYRIVLKNDL